MAMQLTVDVHMLPMPTLQQMPSEAHVSHSLTLHCYEIPEETCVEQA